MAQKRMFSKQIIDSDAFLDMSPTAQLLYFHLVMRADDEGFVGNPKKIMREVGIQGDDFKILVAKRFLIVFETGVVVIKHWLVHNTIRMDRFNQTSYQDEKKLISTKQNNAYTELATNWQPNDYHLVPQVKLSEDNISKDNKYLAEQDEIDFFNTFWKAYPRKQGKAAVETKIKKIPVAQHPAILEALQKHKDTIWKGIDITYIPHPLTWVNQKRWEDEIQQSNIPVLSEIEVWATECVKKWAHTNPEEAEFEFTKPHTVGDRTIQYVANDLSKVSHIIRR